MPVGARTGRHAPRGRPSERLQQDRAQRALLLLGWETMVPHTGVAPLSGDGPNGRVSSARSRTTSRVSRASIVTGVTSTRRDRMILALPFVGVALLAIFSPADDGPTICPFALCTGMACPGCGMTRAASHLIRGDLTAAVSYHPLVPAAALVLAGGWVWFLLRLTGRVRQMSQRTLNLVMIGSAAALLVVWGIRLAAGTLPSV